MKAFDCRVFLWIVTLLLASTLVVQGVSPAGTVVENVAFSPNGESLEVNISVSGEAKFAYFELTKPRRLVVDFPGVQNNVGFKEKRVGSAGVERVRTSFFTSRDRKAARIVFDLNDAARYQVVNEGNGRVRVSFGTASRVPEANRAPLNLVAGPAAVVVGQEQQPLLPVQQQQERLEEQPPVVVANPPEEAARPQVAPAAIPEPALSTLLSALTPARPQQVIIAQPPPATALPAPPPQAQQYTGEIVSLDLKDVDLKDFFRLISDISGLNVVLDPNVGGSLTIVLKEVPWDQALDVVLKNYQLGSQLQGNVLRIATNATLQNEENQRKALRDAQEMAAELSTRMYVLNYQKTTAMQPIMQRMLSIRGTIIQDPTKNALIISDIPGQFGRIEQTIKALDTPQPQVEIEARLVSVVKSFSREFGVQLGFVVGNNTGNVLTGGTRGSSPFERTPPPRVTTGGNSIPLAVDLPAAGTSGIAFLMQPGSDIILDSIITAAEAKGTAKLLSRPKVTTQNNRPATISQGTKIPVQTNVNNTISVQFLDFALRLTVTPQITDAGTILMTVDVENSQPDFARSVNGTPSVATQQATTQMLVQDGGTEVIGGILVDSDSLNIRQVPGLGSIPIVGHLFKNTQTIKSTSELFFFITPRIKVPGTIEVAGAVGTGK